MPTNEEHRKVANELRYTASHSLNGYGFQRAVEGIVFGTLEDRTWRKILERLADLIEPEPERTCHMTKYGPEYTFSGWWACSECGPVYPPCDDVMAKLALKRCPNCGAKVVK